MSFFCVVSSEGKERQLRLRQVIEEGNQGEGSRRAVNSADCSSTPYPEGAQGGSARGDKQTPHNGEPPVIPSIPELPDGENVPSVVINGQQERYRSEIRLSTGLGQQSANQQSCMHWNNDYRQSPNSSVQANGKQGEQADADRQRKESVESRSEHEGLNPEPKVPLSPVQQKLDSTMTDMANRQNKPPLLRQTARQSQSMKGEANGKSPVKPNVGQLRHQWEVLTANEKHPKAFTRQLSGEAGSANVGRRKSSDSSEKPMHLPPKTKPKPKRHIKQQLKSAQELCQPLSPSVKPCHPSQLELSIPSPSQVVSGSSGQSGNWTCVSPGKAEDSGLSSAGSTVSLDNNSILDQAATLALNANDRRISYASKMYGAPQARDSGIEDVLPESQVHLTLTETVREQSLLKFEPVVAGKTSFEENSRPVVPSVFADPFLNVVNGDVKGNQVESTPVIEEIVVQELVSPQEMVLKVPEEVCGNDTKGNITNGITKICEDELSKCAEATGSQELHRTEVSCSRIRNVIISIQFIPKIILTCLYVYLFLHCSN